MSNKVIHRAGLLVCCVLLTANILGQQSNIDRLFEKAPVDSLLGWIKDKDINARCGPKQYTPLIYAIIFNRFDAVKKFIDLGAGLETTCRSKTPLLFALEYNRPQMVHYLVHRGANLQVRDTLMNTPLFYAAGQNNVALLRFLIRKGVQLESRNVYKYTAIEYAMVTGHAKAAKFLKSYFEAHLPNYCDGPYVRFTSKKMAKVYYLEHDSSRSKSFIKSLYYPSGDAPFSFKGFVCDTFSYSVLRTYKAEPDSFPDSGSIFIMGDVHGDYAGMVELLKKGGVINDHLNWQWGDGQLVFLGDVFDRGSEVTECLWLIYKLEQQAQKSGGRVHYLLGNHEEMVLTKDFRYISEKYFYLNDRLKTSYYDHFDSKSALGRWVRSKNTVITIGPYLFVHAGISTDFVRKGYTIHDINQAVRYYLTHQKAKHSNDTVSLTVGAKGPLWYRGYYDPTQQAKPVSQEQVDSILRFYRVGHIFVGHTNIDAIKPGYQGKIIFLDVPYYLGEAEGSALWIKNGKFIVIHVKSPDYIIAQ